MAIPVLKDKLQRRGDAATMSLQKFLEKWSKSFDEPGVARRFWFTWSCRELSKETEAENR